jgi:hypothetical protein
MVFIIVGIISANGLIKGDSVAYQYNIPQSTDQISVSQTDLLSNFMVLGVIAGNTQVASASLNNISGFNFLNLAQQSVIPPVAFAANTIGLYAATTATNYELYINKTLALGLSQIPSTLSTLSARSPSLLDATGCYTYLPSGIILQWATSAFNIPDNGLWPGSPVSFTFPIAFPHQIIQILLTVYSPNMSPLVTLPAVAYRFLGNTSFSGVSTGGNSGNSCFVSYLAIGY